jgi:MFS family permease
MANIYAPLPTGYLVDIFGKKHFVTFKVAAFLIAWSLLFANARTQLHICRVTEGLGTGIVVKVRHYIYIYIYYM